LCCLSFHLWLPITSSASSIFSCPFLLAIVLSVLPSMAFDYLFGIFKLFLQLMKWKFSIKIITLYAVWEFSFLVVVVVVGCITICIISAYHHQISMRARYTTLCDKVHQWLMTGQRFSPGIHQ
jgi:hypothetical protein